jgi:hypothetical protein
VSKDKVVIPSIHLVVDRVTPPPAWRGDYANQDISMKNKQFCFTEANKIIQLLLLFKVVRCYQPAAAIPLEDAVAGIGVVAAVVESIINSSCT